jgi:hypothetical protein
MIRTSLVVVAVLAASAVHAQERVTVLRDRAGKVTGTIRASGPRPTAAEGLAILRNELDDMAARISIARAAQEGPVLRVLAVTRAAAPPKPAEPVFTNWTYPGPSSVSVPLPYPTVQVVTGGKRLP